MQRRMTRLGTGLREQPFRPAKLPNKTRMETPATMETAASPLLIKLFLLGYTVPPGRARVLARKEERTDCDIPVTL